MATVPSFCRNCLAYCPILVTVEGGRAVRVVGDPAAGPFEGYTCPKGRALPDQHNDPRRLLHCMERDGKGGLRRTSPDKAIAEVSSALQKIIDRDGPRAVAMYTGTGIVSHPEGPALAKAFFRAIGSPMVFSAATIDKPAANTSTAMHGNWVAGAQPFDTSDVWMIVGANPLVAKSNGLPSNNPGRRLTDAIRRGLKLIVVDPRKSETARRAHVHLPARPGSDPEVLAGMIRILLAESLIDDAFVAQHARGLEQLREAVAPFTAEFVEERSGVPRATLIEAARVFGGGKRGGVVCSTGPSFSTYSNLSFYLALCLNTLCGRWAREGDEAPFPNVLLPAYTPRAQPYAPYPVLGARAMRVRGMRENASGLPTAALADEILEPGPGRVRALFCLGGNPLLAWPDHARAARAMRDLELLVVFDYRLTATARLAHYVVPPPLSLELPGSTLFTEALKYNGVSRGFEIPWAQYSPAAVAPPPDSEVLTDGEFFFRLAQRMNLQLEWLNVRGYGPHLEQPKESIPLDMARLPTTDDLIELMCRGSRIPLSEVKRHPHGAVFDAARTKVSAADPACGARLELADPRMMADLDAVARRQSALRHEASYPMRLLCQRANRHMNSALQTLPELRHEGLPAVFVHSNDAASLGAGKGDPVTLRSPHGSADARLELDDTLREGTVAFHHGIGDADPPDAGYRSSVNRLVGMDECDPITGIPRMSGIPVRIESRR